MRDRQILFCPDKLAYAQGQRPDVDCILCASRDGVQGVDELIVYRADKFFITLNLYPYNPGHLMIVPNRHTQTIEDFSLEEDCECFHLQRLSIHVLKEMYSPHGFNMGYNIGRHSGASIDHLHFHIVPRYRSELGFMDVVNGTRVIVESPAETKKRMIEVFKIASGKNSFEMKV